MKKIGYSLIVLSLIVVTFIVGGFVWWQDVTSPVSEDETMVRFVIPKGQSAEEVGNALYEKGLVKSQLGFKVYVQLFDKQKNINAGEFLLSPSFSLEEVVDTFGEGPIEVWVTIPEGLRREEIPARVAEALSFSESRYQEFYDEFIDESDGYEGYLFPDTYLFSPDVEAEKVVASMRAVFEKKFDEDIRSDMALRGLTLDETVTLASIIEKETRTDTERPVVAGIFFNRMEIGQALQADATAQYALANIRCRNDKDCDWWVPPTRADLQIDSPYNTYVIPGLPKGPIANPGLSSLKAVVYSEGSDYFYYIHDRGGTIRYGRTLDEHNINVQTYLR